MTRRDRLPHPNSYRVPGTSVTAGDFPFHKDPRRGVAKLTAILDAGITCFVDLTTPADGMTSYEIELMEQAAARDVRLRRLVHGIPDNDVPSVEQMAAVLDALDQAVAAGERPYVHCWGGVGRTGTVIGCYLVRHGMNGEDALRRVGELFATMSREKVRKHPEGSPQTERQRRFVLDWSEPAASRPGSKARPEVEWRHLIVPEIRPYSLGRVRPNRAEKDGDPTDDGQFVERAFALRDRIRGTLIGLAVGDALGAAVEFERPGMFAPVTGMRGGGRWGLEPGQWTDDTSMALCLAESLIDRREFDATDQMQRYVRWWREGHLSSTGKCFDIGGTTADALRRFERTGDPYSGSTERSRAPNGSLMRLAPVPAYFWDHHDAMNLCALSSRTTHGSPIPVDACRYLGGLIIGALRGATRDELLGPFYAPGPGWWDEPLTPEIAAIAAGSFREHQPPRIKGSGYAAEALEAALWAFASSTDFASGALLAVNLGDDADTTGAIYGQLAGAFYGESGIPAEWRQQLAQKPLLDRYAEMLFQLSMSECPRLEGARLPESRELLRDSLARWGSPGRALEEIRRLREEEGPYYMGSMGARAAEDECIMLLRVELGLSFVE